MKEKDIKKVILQIFYEICINCNIDYKKYKIKSFELKDGNFLLILKNINMVEIVYEGMYDEMSGELIQIDSFDFRHFI